MLGRRLPWRAAGTRSFSSRPVLTEQDVNALEDKSSAPDVAEVAPIKSTSVAGAYGGNSYTPSSFLGTTANIAGIRNYTTTSGGGFFTTEDVRRRPPGGGARDDRGRRAFRDRGSIRSASRSS